MEQQTNELRERLLSRLPQPENCEAYRQETAALMAKHERALFWDKVAAITVSWMGVAFFMFVNTAWGRKIYSNGTIVLEIMAILFSAGAVQTVEFLVSRSKVDMLKELKQVQLQVLELQASLDREGGPRTAQ